MKALCIIALTVSITESTFAQTDSVKIINGEYSQLIYNDLTKSFTQSYNYSNKWDFDGDKLNDSLFFIGNGGAHTYYYPLIILSSDGITRKFPTVEIDMPYFKTFEALKTWKRNPSIQLVIDDFDGNGTHDIYLNFNNPFGHIPKDWNVSGVKTNYVLLKFITKKLTVKDY